jgi:hypothetical protein
LRFELAKQLAHLCGVAPGERGEKAEPFRCRAFSSGIMSAAQRRE